MSSILTKQMIYPSRLQLLILGRRSQRQVLLSKHLSTVITKACNNLNRLSATRSFTALCNPRRSVQDDLVKTLLPKLLWAAPGNENKDNTQRNSPPGSSGQQNGRRPPNQYEKAVLITTGVLLTALTMEMMFRSTATDSDRSNSSTITWTQFVNDYLKKGEVEAVYLTKDSNVAFVRLHQGAIVNGKYPVRAHNEILVMNIDNPQKVEEKIRNIEIELGIPANQTLRIVWKDFSMLSSIQHLILFSLLLWILYRFIGRSVKITNPFESITKARYTRGDVSSTSTQTVKFTDIAGMHQAKVEIKEYVEYLKNPARFQSLGATIPKGALLLGPPGCGKTLLAKAVAAESAVPFLVMAGSDFVEMIGGLGASRVRQLFKDARSLRPCIIYIDEIDALGRSRSTGTGFSEGESEHTLNQLLVEMDGMTDNSGIIMLASTNRADVLDRALLRPGRFDRHITIDLPTLSERKELFNMYLAKLSLAKPVGEFVNYLAQATPGMSGADIANVCNEAALHAARENNQSVNEADLSYALDRIIAGQAKMTNTLSETERKTIAYHECGHVLVSWLLKYTDALLKVTIIPRTGAALGFAQYMPSDKKLYSKEELVDMMTVALGGRAAEAIVFNRITTGAENDLDKVRQLAYHQVKTYGMGDSLGLLSFKAEPEQDYQTKPYSKSLQHLMDSEVQQLIADSYKKAEYLINSNRDKLEKLCQILLKQEEMTYEDVRAAIGPPPFGDKKSREYFENVDTTVTN